MTPDEKALIQQIYKTVQENNEILRSLRRSTRWSTAIKISYWAVIILLSFGAFYFIQPYINAVSGASSTFQNNTNEVQNTADALRDLLK